MPASPTRMPWQHRLAVCGPCSAAERHSQWQGKAEDAADADDAVGPDTAAMALYNLARDEEAEAEADAGARLHLHAGHTIEALEEMINSVRGDADPLILYGDNGLAIMRFEREGNGAVGGGILEGVGEQVGQDLLDAIGVGLHPDRRVGQIGGDIALRALALFRDGLAGDFGEVAALDTQGEFARLDARSVQ